jgi:hypothetical protein
MLFSVIPSPLRCPRPPPACCLRSILQASPEKMTTPRSLGGDLSSSAFDAGDAARLEELVSLPRVGCRTTATCRCLSQQDTVEPENSDMAVYACPICKQPFRRWRNAIRHFEVRSAVATTNQCAG